MPSTASKLDPSNLAHFIDTMASHDIRLLAGLDVTGFAEYLALDPPSKRPVLLFDLSGTGSATQLIEAAIAQLARAVADLWPFLWGGEDFSALRDDALGRSHLPIRLAALSKRLPQISQGWAKEAALGSLRGKVPRLHGAPPALEWSQLVMAFSVAGLTIAIPLGSRQVCDAWIRAIEWLALHANVAFVILADEVPAGAAFERIAFGAKQLLAQPAAGKSEALADELLGSKDTSERPIVLALPEADGQPHPQSAVEMRLYKLIQADVDLQPLFAFNRSVPDIPLMQARADLIWSVGRIVIEIDGPEHRAAAKYRADRHRDYQLMCAGYRVLRMTNEDVIADAALALEKIRDVVRLAQREER